MNIHEYQAKELLAKFGVPVPAGYPAMSVEEAVEAAKKLPGPLWVVKSQIHAGGRGKRKFKELGPDAKGGVRLAHSIDEVREHAAEMLGKTLVTVQTGPAGKKVQRLYVTDGVVDAHRRKTGRHRHAERREQLFRLIFVDIHARQPLSRLIRLREAGLKVANVP